MADPGEGRPVVPDGQPVVATIGVFDGVHRGHRALLELVQDRAASLGLPSLVVTFDPHPVSVLAPRVTRHRLFSHSGKLRLLADLGMNRVLVLPFSKLLASLPAGEFVERYLVEEAAVRELWVGYDFRFGRGREGDVGFLRREGERLGFEVGQFGPIHRQGRVVSSTWVREALGRGDLDEVLELLGHSFWLEGQVIRGRGEGARLLVPTANLELPPEQCLPANGVYPAWAELDGTLHPAVVNVGLRPTLVQDSNPLVEAYLIDWQGDLYGRRLLLHFGTRLRPELRFEGLEPLREAIRADVEAARGWLAARRPSLIPGPVSSRREPPA